MQNYAISSIKLFYGCRVAELMKNEHQLGLTIFLDYSSLDNEILFSCERGKLYYWCEIRLQLLLRFFDDCVVTGKLTPTQFDISFRLL